MNLELKESNIRNVHNLEKIQEQIRTSKYVNHSSVIERFKNNRYLDDPLFLGYRPFFHYLDNRGLLANEENVNSALAYLDRIGENRRYQSLKQFIRMLQKINVDMTYMFQTIEGLQEAKDNFDKPMCYDNNTVVFGMLETIDMRIQGLLHLYRDIAYDSRRHVWVLPRNLRQFSCSICVFPIGVYAVSTDGEKEAIPNAIRDDTTVWEHSPADAVNMYNHVMFEFAQCEFNIFGSSQGFVDSVSNNEMNMALNTLSFTYMRVRQSGLFKTLLGNTKVSGASLGIVGAMKDKKNGGKVIEWLKEAGAPIFRDINKLKERYKAVVDENGKVVKSGFKNMFEEMYGSTRDYVLRNAQSFLANQVNRLYMGNIYDITASDIVALAGSRNIENAIINGGNIVQGLKNKRGTSGQGTPPEGNIFDRDRVTNIPMKPANMYEKPTPSTPEKLDKNLYTPNKWEPIKSQVTETKKLLEPNKLVNSKPLVEGKKLYEPNKLVNGDPYVKEGKNLYEPNTLTNQKTKVPEGSNIYKK